MHHGRDRQKRVWVLAGTGEGPHLVSALLQRGWQVQVSVVTPQAAQAYTGLCLDQLHVGALAGPPGISDLLDRCGGFRWVVDATHPFATQISDQLQQVCSDRGQPLLRLLRAAQTGGEVVVLSQLADLAAQRLTRHRILLAIGGRRLATAVAAARAADAEVFARVLPSIEGLRAALAVGLPADQLAVLRPLQGEASGSIERALIRRWQITDVLCRQSGGVTEHLWRSIAMEHGLRLWLLKRPAEPLGVETVVGVQELLQRLDHAGATDCDPWADDGG